MPIWPFRRRRREATTDRVTAPAVAPARTPTRPVDEWRSLPPIPTSGRLELTAPVQRLSDGITPHRPTSVASEPM
nr:hypothetical protein [Ilumatobacteraceae bacterium]